MSTAPDIQEAAPRPRRRYLRLKILAVLAILALGYLWFPRSKPDYIRLPSGHGPVKVKTWLILPAYRQFYVKTRVSRPWRVVADELGCPEKEFGNHIDWDEQTRSTPESSEAGRKRSSAVSSARPIRHGYHGDPLPASFVTFSLSGPDKTASQHHVLYYRLTDHSGTETTVEVWDNRFYDH